MNLWPITLRFRYIPSWNWWKLYILIPLLKYIETSLNIIRFICKHWPSYDLCLFWIIFLCCREWISINDKNSLLLPGIKVTRIACFHILMKIIMFIRRIQRRKIKIVNKDGFNYHQLISTKCQQSSFVHPRRTFKIAEAYLLKMYHILSNILGP